jgi:hypothetical protein
MPTTQSRPAPRGTSSRGARAARAKAAARGSRIAELESDAASIERAARQDRAVERSVYGEKRKRRRPAARDVARIHAEDNVGRDLSRIDRTRVATFEAARDRKTAEKVRVVRRFDANRWTTTLLSDGDESDT